MFANEMRKGVLSLSVLACLAVWCCAARGEVVVSGVHHSARLANSQSQAAPKAKVLRDKRDHISFSYPATYVVDRAASVRWQKQAAARHATAHIAAWLSDKSNDAQIVVMLVPVPFDLNYIRRGAPTGMEDWFWLRFTAFSGNKFYFYSGGNMSQQHPDEYLYNLDNAILSFSFDGPYSPRDGTIPDWAKVGPIETLVLGSLNAPVNQRAPFPPGSFRYTSERYGFQLTLNSAWRGFEVSQRGTGSYGVTYLVFSVPGAGYAGRRIDLIRLGVQSPQTWQKRRRLCECVVNSVRNLFNPAGATLIGRTRAKVFSLEYWNIDSKIRTRYQINRVIESFKVLR